MKKKLLITALAVMLLGSSFPVYAAPEYMADGNIFDAEWYLEQNPDVAAAFPAGVSAEVLYQHYVTCGVKEGRTPYNVLTFDPANVLPYQGAAETMPDTPVPSNLTPSVSFNKDAQNYRWYNNYNWNWADTVKSYLYENQIGGYPGRVYQWRDRSRRLRQQLLPALNPHDPYGTIHLGRFLCRERL